MMEINEVKEQMKSLLRSVMNDKWITIKPHGEDSDDYRRLKLEDGETPKEAIERTYGKDNKDNKQEKEEQPKEEKPNASDSPFGEGVEITEHDKKGYMLDSKNLKSFKKGEKFAILDDWTNEDGERYTVSFHDGKKRLESKTYTTKRGMEKAIREHLQGGANKETKALETKTDLGAAEARYKDVLKKYNEAGSKRWKSGITPQEYNQAWDDYEKYKKELTTARREYAESIMSNFESVEENPWEDKQAARRERYEELSDRSAKESSQAHQQFRDKMSAIPMGQPILVGHHSEQRDRRYREKAWDTLGKAVKLSDKANYYEGKANSVGKAGISADDANAIAKLAQKYKSGVSSAEKRRIIDRVIDIHKNRQLATDTSKQTDYSNLGFQVERNADINRLQLKFDGKPDESVRSVLKSNGFRWSPREGAWQRQLGGNSEYGLNRVVEKLKTINNSLLEGLDKILTNTEFTEEEHKLFESINNLLDPNTVNNDKEQEMALLEELKKLITNVENDKGDDMDDKEKIENEKVDKRKLIDEVGGILKGKVDDEIIRTIIGKLEKVAYDESEAGKADNEKDEEKEVECCKKVKNEEEDKEDKKEVKEVEEDVKEDVDNKCKNSKEDYFSKMNEIYNAASSALNKAPEYVSIADREQAAEEYFAK